MRADEMRRHLAVLGLELGADLRAARAARRALLKRWHPDRFLPGSPEAARATVRAQEINEAFREAERGFAEGVPSPPDWDPREWPAHGPGAGDLAPAGFRDLAWRLRAGERPLDLRNEIVARERIPKVAAARRVENVERALRAARAGLVSGGLTLFAVAAAAWSGVVRLPALSVYVVFALAQIVPAVLALRAARPPTGGAR